MSRSIDERIVSASFENAKFEAGVSKTMGTLGKLESALAKAGSASGLKNIEAQADKVSFTGLSRAIDGITNKFGVLQTVGVAALGTITAKATLAAGQLAKSITLGPLTQGFEEYSTNLNSIQTILANTQASGAGLRDVNKALQELNRYSDKTIYNFSEMAKNIGTFTAAGVDLKTATGSIKGIANLAALSGSNSQQASTAMYQLSQAIAAGRVSLQDWNSVVNAGMGGTVFQRALAQTAKAMGTLDDNAVSLSGKMKNVKINGESFRESITARPGQKSWLTSKVLTSTLQQFTGDLSNAQLAAMGFNEEQIKSIQKTAQTAKHAATEVKTIKGVFDVAKESIGSGWAATFQIIFGNFGEAKTTFTALSTAIQNVVGNMAKARNAILKDWKQLGGRAVLIDSIRHIFEALRRVVGIVKDSFRDIFPRKTGKQLFDMTKNFHEFAKALIPSKDTIDLLRRTFRGFFAILAIGKYILGQVVGAIFELLGIAGEGSGGFLKFTAAIGDFLTALKIAVVNGDALHGFFKTLVTIIRAPLNLLKDFVNAIGSLFDTSDSQKGQKVADTFAGVNEKLKPMQKLIDNVSSGWQKLLDFFGRVGDSISSGLDKLLEPFRKLGNSILDAFKQADFSKLSGAINTVLLGGIFVAIKKGLGKGIDVTVGKIDGFNKVFSVLTGNLTAMQKNVQAHTLLTIATAIAVLAAGVALLSSIDPKKLSTALTAVAVGLAQLVAAMAVLGKATGGGGGGKFSKAVGLLELPAIGAAMIEVAVAVTILAGAMKILSTMSWEDISKGLSGIAAGITAIGLATKLMGPSLTLTAPGVIAIAVAISLLGGAMKIFATMSWEDIAKGVSAMAGALIAIGVAMKLMGPTLTLTAPGLIGVAFGIGLLAGAVLAFGSMDMETLAKGILGITIALDLIGLAIQRIPPTIALQAAGLLILAAALSGLAGSVALMGGMDLSTMAKGLLGIGAALLILGYGLDAMAGALPGSVALLAATAALAILAPTIAFLGTLKITTILTGLGAVAAILLVLALAGEVATPGLVALGIALTTLAIPVVFLGAGMYLLAKAFTLLGQKGTIGMTALLGAIALLIAALPKMMIEFAKGILEILAGIAELAPKMVDSMVKILAAVLQVIIDSAPKVAEAVGALIQAFLTVLNDNIDSIIQSGFHVLLAFLSGMVNHIGKVTEKVGLIVARFLNALANRTPDLITAGANLLIAFLDGIGNNAWRVVRSATRTAGKFLIALGKGLAGLADSAAKAVITFLNALAKVIEKRTPELILAGERIGKAIAKGIVKGIKDAAADALNIFPGEGNPLDPTTKSGKKFRDRIRQMQQQANPKQPGSKFTGPHKLAVLDLNPTLTPVLDLTQVEAGAQRLTEILAPDIGTTTSGKNAAAVSREKFLADAVTAMTEAEPIRDVIFEQHNSSPETLPDREIYRRTNSMLGQAKNVLARRRQ